MTVQVADTTFKSLRPRIEAVVRGADKRKDVIVLDIDATVLYNTDEPLVGADPNFKMQPIYDLARTRQVPVHFVTARIGTPQNRAATLRQLHAMGFDWFHSLYMRPPSTPPTSEAIARYKLNARKAIAQNGNKNVLLNVGDQWTDLLVVDAQTAQNLDSKFPKQHVMFTPHKEYEATHAVKLFEYRH